MDEAEEDVFGVHGLSAGGLAAAVLHQPTGTGNKEINRRAYVVGIFSNDAAIMRLVGTLLLEQSDEWQVTRRYMSAESLAKLAEKKEARALLETDAVA